MFGNRRTIFPYNQQDKKKKCIPNSKPAFEILCFGVRQLRHANVWMK